MPHEVVWRVRLIGAFSSHVRGLQIRDYTEKAGGSSSKRSMYRCITVGEETLFKYSCGGLSVTEDSYHKSAMEKAGAFRVMTKVTHGIDVLCQEIEKAATTMQWLSRARR